MKIKKISIFSLVLGLSFLVTQPVLAQTADRISVTAIPPRLGDDGSLSGAPGETLQTTIRLKNNNDIPLNFVTAAYDYVISEDGETPLAVNENVNPRWSLADWITVAPAANSLAPNEVANIQVVIQIPEDALPGGHYAMVTHRPDFGNQNDQEQGSGSSVTQQTGTLLYVIVEGPINEQAFLRGLNFPKFTELGPVDFAITVDNQSDIHITPQVSVEIYNLLGQKVDTIQLDAKNVFPLMSRELSGQWTRIWGTGFYKAKAIMSYGDQAQVAFAQTSFWLLPIKLIAMVIIVILFLIIMLVSFKRYLNHRQQQSNTRIKELEKQLKQLKDFKK